MSRQINDIVLTGQGLLVTFDDNQKEQFVWQYKNGRLGLSLDGEPCPNGIVSEIIGKVTKCNRGTTLWAHFFGTASDHVTAADTDQIGLALSPNTWTDLVFNDIVTESQEGPASLAGINLDPTTGIISLPPGEYYTDVSAVCHRAGAGGSDGVVVSIQALDIDTGLEIPYSFHQVTVPPLANAPGTIKTSYFLNLVAKTSLTRIKFRVQADSNKCTLGAEAGKVPVGSLNHAGFLNVFRVG